MRTYRAPVALAFVSLACAPVFAADWPEWRGPDRNGLVAQSPALINAVPADGLKRVWLSDEKVPVGEYINGYGSLVVADGRVYLRSAPQRKEPIATRTLTEAKLVELGWPKTKPPDDLLKKIDAARLSDERAALTDNKAVQAWVKTWVDANLDTAARKTFGPFAADRLSRGKAALDLALLDKLATIEDKEFATQAALDEWLDANAIAGDVRKRVLAQVPVDVALLDNLFLCLDAATGKTLWKKTFENHYPAGVITPGDNAPSSTPCVAGGKVYLLGVNGAVFCLNAKTGDPIWTATAGAGKRQRQCSFAVIDGVAVVPAGPLTAFDANKGDVVWKRDDLGESFASPTYWKKDGKTYLIVRAGNKLTCFDAKPGTIVWSIDEPKIDQNYGGSTPAIEGDRMAVSCQSGVRLYRLSPTKAELAFDVKCPMDYDSLPTIYQGYVYVFGRSGSTCINVETGKTAWQDKTFQAGAYNAPIVADGKFFIQGYDPKPGGYGDGSLCIVRPTPEKAQVLGQTPLKQALCTTPPIVDGRLYCRLPNGVACFDITAGPATQPAK